MGQSGAYFQYARDDIAALVPRNARRVLDVGCAAGRLGANLKTRRACEVYGVEIAPGVAEQAKQVLDQVVVGDVEALDLPFPDGFFDCIVYADVLEHLRRPLDVLLRHYRYLSPDGSVVASVPNVRSHEVLLPLLFSGVWRYQTAGVLDENHLRFFTRRTAHEMLERGGYEPVRTLYSVPGAPVYTRLDQLTLGLLKEFLAVQILVLARKAPRTGA